MGRTVVRATAIAAVLALFGGGAASSAAAFELTADDPSDTQRYIVVLDGASLAEQSGTMRGAAASAPASDSQLNAGTPDARRYVASLLRTQRAVAESVGATPAATYQIVLNGFSADLTADQVEALGEDAGVRGVYADERRTLASGPSAEYLGLGSVSDGLGGVWDALGGAEVAGAGVVIGVVDSGIAASHPSFSGTPLGEAAGSEPYLSGGDVVFARADGGNFRSTLVAAPGWSRLWQSTTLIGARTFSDGARAAGFSFDAETLTPHDVIGHGSHVASVAAGGLGVAATLSGVDAGQVAGVAPAAKIAAYKACWAGADPRSSQDDLCALSDVLSAVDAAVADGVDVLTYALSRGAGTDVDHPEELALRGAAGAGVFVAVAAGNDGATAAPRSHQSPWYTTVGASTVTPLEGTVILPSGDEFVGASATVPADASISGRAVYAGDIPAADAAPDDAALCMPGALDADQAEGAIVVCDRGVTERWEKSDVVAEAGGIGMVLVNVSPASIDEDAHAIPTVHVSDEARRILLGYVRGNTDAQLTLVGGSTLGSEIPVPQVAEFSARGGQDGDADPVLPDVTAPGVSILAAGASLSRDEPTFSLLSGTSVAAAHVAGLAALYLGAHPEASPSEVRSALMTTAGDTLDADGAIVTDPFAQGAGQVDVAAFLEPGLLYLADADQWRRYADAVADADPDTARENLNDPSITVGALAEGQTLTRRLTAAAPGTFDAFFDVPGIDAVIEPASLEFTEAGQTKTFTITLLSTGAIPGEWATGSLTWTDGVVWARSPVAVLPAGP